MAEDRPGDARLLSDYADTGSEEAFAERLRRQVNLVHSAALRQVKGDGHRLIGKSWALPLF